MSVMFLWREVVSMAGEMKNAAGIAPGPRDTMLLHENILASCGLSPPRTRRLHLLSDEQ